MADLSEKGSSLTVKITGASSTGSETNFIDATVNGIKIDGSAVTQPISATNLPLPDGAASETTLAALNAKSPILGQATMSASVPVTIASNQLAIPVTGNLTSSVIPNAASVGSITTLNGTVEINTSGYATVGLKTAGTWVATLVVEASVDGTNFSTVNGSYSSGVGSAFTTNLSEFLIPSSGYQKIRVRASAFTSGAVSVTLLASSTTSSAVKVFVDPTSPLPISYNLKDGSGVALPSSIDVPATTDRGLNVRPVASTKFLSSVANTGTTSYFVDVSGYSSLILQVTGTWTGDIQWFGSVDGTNFSTVLYGADILVADGELLNLTNTNRFVQLNVAGFRQIAFQRTILSGSATLSIGLKDSSSLVTSVQGTIFTKTDLRDGTGNAISSVVDNDGERHLSVSMVPDNELSTGNSSTANLAAGATFTGTGIDARNFNAINIFLFTTQNCTVSLQKSSDGTNWDAPITYTTTANTSSVECLETNGLFLRVLVTNNGGAATTAFRLKTSLQVSSPTPITTKATQTATAITTQDMKDTGRQLRTFYATFTGSTTEGLVNLIPNNGGTAGTAATSHAVTSGKRLRVQSISVSTRNAGAAGQGIVCQVRITASGAVTTTSPVVGTVAAGTKLATSNVTDGCTLTFSDGLELTGTQQIGVTQVGSLTANHTVVITAYEY